MYASLHPLSFFQSENADLPNVMAVPMGEITRALVGVRRRLCVKWGFVDMDVYEQEYRFYYFARCPYEKTDTTFRSIPLTTESFPQKEGGEAV